jgi:predicted dehydrogenase
MLKIGLVGTGHLGKIHLRNLLELPVDFEVVGFYDTDHSVAMDVQREFQTKSLPDLEELMNVVDALLIACPTPSHFPIAVQALKKGKHIFIEKPVCFTVEESKKLLLYAQEAGVVVQVGHVERFNPALLAASPFVHNPLFIESRRTAPFQKRGTDVSVVYDLMIHDIDIAMTIANSNVKKISAFGMNVLSDSIDVASAYLSFENGCAAYLSASRVSDQRERKSCFFMRDSHVYVDFLNKTVERHEILEDLNVGRQLHQTVIPVEDSNAIKLELLSFAQSIRDGMIPAVSLTDGHRALQIAELILDQIYESNQFYQIKTEITR